MFAVCVTCAWYMIKSEQKLCWKYNQEKEVKITSDYLENEKDSSVKLARGKGNSSSIWSTTSFLLSLPIKDTKAVCNSSDPPHLNLSSAVLDLILKPLSYSHCNSLTFSFLEDFCD